MFSLKWEGSLMVRKKLLSGVALALALVWSGAAQADTVGLWFFDGGPTGSNLPDGAVFPDSSGNNLDFVYTELSPGFPFAKVQYSTDVPPVIGAGRSLSIPDGSGRVIDTPSTDLFNPAKTGQFTVEFWHKNLNLGFQNVLGLVAPLEHAGGQAPGQSPNRWQITTGLDELISPDGLYEYNTAFFGTTGGGGNRTILETSTADALWGVPDVWKHFALTADLVTRNAFMYVDGVEVASATGLVLSNPIDRQLRLLSNAASTNFNGHAMVDEIRISNVALLPGNGTGNGELAWNASLVPEPSTLGLLLLGGLTMLSRRRS
jgi:hypothetical protein